MKGSGSEIRGKEVEREGKRESSLLPWIVCTIYTYLPSNSTAITTPMSTLNFKRFAALLYVYPEIIHRNDYDSDRKIIS